MIVAVFAINLATLVMLGMTIYWIREAAHWRRSADEHRRRCEDFEAPL